MKLSRRKFIYSSATVAASLGLYGWRIEPHWIEITHHRMAIAALPPALHSATLVHLSDIHVGPRVDDDFLIETFERVSTLSPDFIVITGDLISYHPGVFEQAAKVFRHLPHGRVATFGVLGNHDYGPNWSHPEVADEVTALMKSLNVQILRNEVANIRGLQLLGLDDVWGTNYNPENAFRQLQNTHPMLALSHNPDTADAPIWKPFSGWILSGHTHGGQCKPPFLPPPLLPVKNRRYTSGAFQLAPERSMYISRGIGHLIRVRFNVRPEVAVFHLVEA